tara:strand:- start:226 stop:1443 length:1218 start_codon:yes stop_codon:yes gene_type:complete
MSVFEGRAWISNQGLVDVSIEVDNGYISSVKKTNLDPNKEKVNGLILPAAMDMHVHFRDPGYPNKEDWKTGSESAACGGVTAVVDMPNTNPFTSNLSLFKEKEKIAKSKSVVDFGIGINVEEGLTEQEWFDTVPAAFWKLYPYGVSAENYFRLAKEVLDKTNKPLVIHCEHPDYMHNNPLEKLSDHTQNRLIAEEKCLSEMPSSEYLHVAHLSTSNGLKNLPALSSTEVCPHHLLLNLDNCSSLDCKVDPPLRNISDNHNLYDAYRTGTIPILASDHAPHTIEEKRSDEPPSGMPGVETMVPLMLQEVVDKRLELSRLVNSMAEAPADRLGLNRGRIASGQPADFMFVDLKDSEKIVVDKLHSRSNWSPFEDWQAIFPYKVYRRGELISENSEIVSTGGGINIFD